MSDDGQGRGTRIIGSLRAADGRGIVRIEDRFDTGIDDLWSTFVDPDRLGRWLGEVDGDLRPGGEFRALFRASGWEGTGRVELCEPPRHLRVLTWDAESAAEHTMEAWLRADGAHTSLVVEERGMPIDHLAAYGAGLQIHVEDLAAYLAGRERPDTRTRWEELTPAYRDLATGP